MPKFTCEVDTDAKIFKFHMDGKEVLVDEFSIGHYPMFDHCGGPLQKTGSSTYVSMGQRVGEETYNYSVRFDDTEHGKYDEIRSNDTIAKDMGKIINRIFAKSILSKTLFKKS